MEVLVIAIVFYFIYLLLSYSPITIVMLAWGLNFVIVYGVTIIVVIWIIVLLLSIRVYFKERKIKIFKGARK